MSARTKSLIYPETAVLRGPLAISIEAMFIACAVLFPMATHAAGWPVFALLPMHWTILLAGLVFGWRAGLLAGLLAPTLSFVTTGMPIPAVLPLMTLEVAIYGGLTGALREKSGLNSFAVMFISLVAGRIGFSLLALSLGRVEGSLIEFMQASFSAGLPAAAAQLLILPFVAAGISAGLQKE